ncbi:MAG: ChaN family lipoprotein, partial [Pseudomonadota bacterium]|nr:ChaN family lipoprotein [Pseudomonadota bacterium]
MRMLIAAVLATFVAPPLHADEAADALFTAADIALLGEVHDNPDHHLEQARIVTAMQPAALVFEMLTPAQVTAAEGVDRQDLAALAGALGWADSGWPDFQIYAPVFAAAPMAQLYGAGLPRAQARAAYS